MATARRTEDYSKRERIINALAVYPERYEFSAEVVAELADASESYVYRIQRDIDAGGFDGQLDEELQHQFGERLGELLEERAVERTIDREEGAEGAESVEDGEDDASGREGTPEERRGIDRGEGLVQDAKTRDGGGLSVEQIREVRGQLELLRREAEFGRENFEEEAVDVAHGKYYVANQAIELLDELVSSPRE